MTPGPLPGDTGAVAEPAFRSDLYRGTARYYDRYRLPYPQALIHDLAGRAEADGAGRLLDLACGTGQLTFALRHHFAEVWAVDQEPEMAGLVREKAVRDGIPGIRPVVSAAENLAAPDDSFDLVTIGNAFHRLPRGPVAASVIRWLRPGRYLALAWGDSPWDGEAPWQQAMSAAMRRWRARAADRDRIPAGYGQARRECPDLVVLRRAGFETVGRYEFTVPHVWTAGELAGFLLSTSVLSRAALCGAAAEFAADLGRELQAAEPSGRFRQTLSFAYDLARRPP